MCGVLEFSGPKHNSVLPPKPLTGSVSVNRVDDDAISIAFPSTNSQNSNSNKTEIVKWKRRLRKHPFYTLYNSNISEDTRLNKTGKLYQKFHKLLQAGHKIFLMEAILEIFHLWKNLML